MSQANSVPALCEAQNQWFGFDRLDFLVAGRPCLLILPNSPRPGRPWIWRTEFFGHEPQADLSLLAHGFHVAYMDMQDMYGAPPAMECMDAFHAFLTAQHALSARAVLEGFSRGGLFALNWAARQPAKVACLYLDAPVCDFKSWPAGRGTSAPSPDDWQRCKAMYGLTEEQALAYPLNPVDNLRPLRAANLPILCVCGGADTIVPMSENTSLLESRYRELGGQITVIAKPECDHHPHSLPDPAPIVTFILAHTAG